MSQPAYLFVGGPLNGSWKAVPGEPHRHYALVRDMPDRLFEGKLELDPCDVAGYRAHEYRRMRIRGASWAFYVSAEMSAEDWLATLVAHYKPGVK
jgi:hypothetical protein